MILLDSNHLSILKYHESERSIRLVARLALSGDPVVGAPVICVEEQMRGWMASIAKERQPERQVYAYRELAGLFSFFARLPIVPFDDAAAVEFKSLRKSHRRIGAMDLKIAATALIQQALLLTANLRHFEGIPGLRVENWLD